MGIVPKGKGNRITWYKIRVPKWAEDPEAIGTTAEQVAELEAIVEEARLARVEQYRAQQAAQAATLRLHNAMERLSVSGGSIVLQIRSKAVRGDDPSVYSKASIPAPRRKSRLPAPGTPYDFNFKLHQVGWATLSWKCDNPKNAVSTTYHVYRQINGEGRMEYLGNVAKKKCFDKTLPRGVTSVTYQIQAVRSTCVGVAARFDVRVGGYTEHQLVQRTKWDLRKPPGTIAA